MSQAFSQYINLIGKGKKSGKCLTREQAYESMKMVLAGEVTGEQRGAFLMLLRTREETPEEITGFTDACRESLVKETRELHAQLDIGCYAGKRRQQPWYLLAVAALVQQGVKVCLHGAHETGSQRLYASHVLPDLGLPLAESVTGAAKQLEQSGATYLDLGQFHPQLNEIIQLRAQFGLRSCANTLARLLNPSHAPFSVQGVHHVHLDEKHHHVNENYKQISALCFRGDGGDPEVNQESKTELFICRQGQGEVVTLPEQEGWAFKDKEMDVNDMLAVWQQDTNHHYGEQAVLGTLAAYLILLEQVSIEQAYVRANEVWQARACNQLPFHSA